MKVTATTVWSVRWTIAFSVLLGVILSSSATSYLVSSYKAWYDDTHPVVVMSGVLVSKTKVEATIHVGGEKLRDCRFVSLHAYSRKGGTLTDAYKERINLLEDSSSKPKGTHDLGRYRIWPLLGADTVIMRVLHDCDGRFITTQIAEVKL